MDDIAYRFTTVRQVLEYYMENRGYHVESWEDLANMTSVFVAVMGRKPLQLLIPDVFITYISARRSGRIGKRPAKSDGTIRRELQHLKAAINFCVEARLVNPAHVPTINMPAPPPPRDRWFEKQELESITAAAKKRGGRVLTFVMVARYTAARKTAICKLQWDQVNFATNMIDFTKHQRAVTKKRRVVVPMHPELRKYLEILKESAATDFVLEITRDIRALIDAVANQAKVDGVTPHVFRHTWATHASMNGVSMTEIARVLGDTVATVERIYAKFAPNYLKNAIEQAAL